MEKICFITPQFKTGGGNRVFVELANELIKNNEVEIIYPNNSLEKNTFELNEKVKTISIGKYFNSKILKLCNMLYTLFWIRKNKKDYYLIITDPIMSLFYFLLPQKKLYRFVQADDYRIFDDRAVINNLLILKVYKTLTKLSYRSKKIKYIFNSKYVYEMFLKDGKNNTNCNIVHPSINKKIFYDKNIREENKINICIVARRHPMKGFNSFIEAWKRFELKDKINEVYIISHDDLSSFDLSDKKIKIVVPKSDEEIATVMNKSHIFISTSWWEGFGLPPLEAMSCRSSVIVSDSGGVNEYAKNEYNCLIYTPKDVNELLKKMNELVENTSKREKLVENSKETIKRFSWEKSSLDFLEILEKNKIL